MKFDGSTEAPRKCWPHPVLLLAALALVLLPAVLSGGWALDDRELIFDNPVVNGSAPWYAAFERDYFHFLSDSGQWRPLASLSLRLDHLVFGSWVTGYHLMNWLQHISVAVLAWLLLRELGTPWKSLRFGLIVFFLHPALCDSVIWISGRTSMLSALFPLAGILFSQRLNRLGKPLLPSALPAAIGLLAGLLAKEDALVFALLAVVLAARTSRKHLQVMLCTMFVVIFLWCAGRALALGAPLPSAASPALGSAPLLDRLLVGGASILEGLRITLLPWTYPPQYREAFLLSRAEPLPASVAAVLGWALLCVPLVLATIRRRSCSTALVGTCLAAVAFLPFTQIVPLGEIFAPRFLYLPLLFAIPLVGVCLERTFPARVQVGLTIALTLVLGYGCWERATVYTSRGSWREAVLKHIPFDAPSLNDMGLYLEEQGDIPAALASWQLATQQDPRYSRSWSNLGRAQLEMGDLEQAEKTLRRAASAGPINPIPRVNLGTLLARRGDHDEAIRWYTEATQLSPGLAPAWLGLARSLLEVNRLVAAESAAGRALTLDPDSAGAHALQRHIDARKENQRSGSR
jgi:protein O-mannosyl-transferase